MKGDPAKRQDETDIIDQALTENEIGQHEIIELLFFAYRDFISDPDAILAKVGFGRAHHRVVYFVNRDPGMTVATLLDTLRITKQSLARVLKDLVDCGYIRQVAGLEDRRQRRLYPTRAGRAFALELAAPQSRRVSRALSNATPQMRDSVLRFLAGMKDDPSVEREPAPEKGAA